MPARYASEGPCKAVLQSSTGRFVALFQTSVGRPYSAVVAAPGSTIRRTFKTRAEALAAAEAARRGETYTEKTPMPAIPTDPADAPPSWTLAVLWWSLTAAIVVAQYLIGNFITSVFYVVLGVVGFAVALGLYLILVEEGETALRRAMWKFRRPMPAVTKADYALNVLGALAAASFGMWFYAAAALSATILGLLVRRRMGRLNRAWQTGVLH